MDIETAPNTVYTWGLFKQNVSINQIVEPGRMMCWAAQWVGSKEVLFASEFHHDDMIPYLWELMDEADVIVTYNGKRFDIPTINKEFAKAGLAPPSRYRQVDLYQVVKSNFRFASNKMDFVCQELGLGSKTQHTGMILWRQCMGGVAKAWKLMRKYCRQDVKLTTRLYLKLLPWIKNHPNHGMYVDSDDPICPNCGSDHVIKKGWEVTQTRKYRRYRCMSCLAPLQARTLKGTHLK